MIQAVRNCDLESMGQGCNVWMKDSFLKRYIGEGEELILPPNKAPY
jgi:hypothetical protein